jgi:hypothetical protein
MEFNIEGITTKQASTQEKKDTIFRLKTTPASKELS